MPPAPSSALAFAAWMYLSPEGALGKLDAIGYAVCHRIDARSFHIDDRQLPLCARCTGEFYAAGVALIFQVFVSGKRSKLPSRGIIDRWHNSHTPLSLRYHPLWNYNRNVVDEYLTTNDAAFHGIVEEQVRERRDLLNPFRFFGNPLVIIPRMIHVYLDTKSFIDYPTMETFLAKAYVVRSK